MQFLREYFDPVLDILNYQLFVLGETRITPFGVIYVLCLIVALFYLSNRLKNLLVNKLLTRTRLDTGAQQAIGTITRYLILFVGLLIIFQTVGIDLTALSVLAGAVGIGIGFGIATRRARSVAGVSRAALGAARRAAAIATTATAGGAAAVSTAAASGGAAAIARARRTAGV